MKLHWWMALLLVGCSSSDASERVCAACEPEEFGDTGDLGGSLTPCWAFRAPEEVDAARAVELGFDVEGMERAAARALDMPFVWRAAENFVGGAPASGYGTALTTISVRVQSMRSYRHMRPDPQYCDGTTCRLPGMSVPQATCSRALETDVQVEVATADDAVRASLTGTAMQIIAGSEGEGKELAQAKALVSAGTRLSEVQGTLRLAPKPGAESYRTRLGLSLWCNDDGTTGELSPSVFIKESEVTGTDYWPLNGSFPPVDDAGLPQLAAGAER